LPVLSLHPAQISNYRLRRSSRSDHFCTSEVGALCLALAGEPHAAEVLDAYLAVFTHHYLQAKNQQPLALEDAAHQRLRRLARATTIKPLRAAPCAQPQTHNFGRIDL
jgi:DTW domain-containing protein YfiP